MLLCILTYSPKHIWESLMFLRKNLFSSPLLPTAGRDLLRKFYRHHSVYITALTYVFEAFANAMNFAIRKTFNADCFVLQKDKIHITFPLKEPFSLHEIKKNFY